MHVLDLKSLTQGATPFFSVGCSIFLVLISVDTPIVVAQISTPELFLPLRIMG